MGSLPEQDQNLYDYVICGYFFIEDWSLSEALTYSLAVEQRAVFWLAVLLRTPIYRYF